MSASAQQLPAPSTRMASGHSGALGAQQQIPATIQPLQTLTQSFVAKHQQQQNRHNSGTYSSAFSNGPTSLQQLASSSSPSLAHPSQQQPLQSPRRYYDVPSSSSATTPVLAAHQPQPNAEASSSTDMDTQMQTDEVVPAPPAEATDSTVETSASTASVNRSAPPSNNEKRKRGRPKGSKTKRGGTKGEGHEQLHQQEIVMTTDPPPPSAPTTTNSTTTSPSIQHLSKPQPSTSAAPPNEASSSHSKEENQAADSFAPTFYSFLDASPLPPEHTTENATKGADQTMPPHRTQAHSPRSRNEPRTNAPSTSEVPGTSVSPQLANPSMSKESETSADDSDMMPVYEFYWSTMSLCSDFFQAVSDLLVSIQSKHPSSHVI